MRLPLSVLVLLACACSTAADAPVPTLAEYIAQEQGYSCTAIYTCLFGVAPSESVAFCGVDGELVDARTKAVAAGRMKFDAKAAATCVAEFAKLDPAQCFGVAPSDLDAEITRVEALCRGALAGSVANDSACFFGEECASGFCDATAQQCPGKCRAPRAGGEECAANSQCSEGLACVAKKCVRPGARDEACDAARPCARGLRCGAGKCTSLLGSGDSCDLGDDECGSGLFCDVSGRCAAKVAAGGECRRPGVDFGVESPACVGRQACVGLVLDEDESVLTAGRCATPHDVGGSCEPTGGNPGANDSGCFLGISCTDAKTCAALPGPGSACAGTECNQEAFCEAGTCRALRADGEACTGNAQCLHACLSATHLCGPATPASRCRAP